MDKLQNNRLKKFLRSDGAVFILGMTIVLLQQNAFVSAILPHSHSRSSLSSTSHYNCASFVCPLTSHNNQECTMKSNRGAGKESFLTTLTDIFPTTKKRGTTLLKFRREKASPSITYPHDRTKPHVFSYHGQNDLSSWERKKQFEKRRKDKKGWRLRDIFARKTSSRREAIATDELISTDSKMINIQTMGLDGEIERKDTSFPLLYGLEIIETDDETSKKRIRGKIVVDKTYQKIDDTKTTSIQDGNDPQPSMVSESSASPTDKKVTKRKSKSKNATTMDQTNQDELSMIARFSRRIFQRTIHLLLCRWSIFPPHNLQVVSSPRGNVLSRLLSKGEIASDVSIDFDRLVFHNLRMSGGRIDIKHMSLKVLANVPTPIGRRFHQGFLGMKMRRFSSPFEFHAQNCTFTQDDVRSSSCIQNGLQNLLNNILNRSGFLSATSVKVSSVKILPSKKISCIGTATTALGAQVPFEVRTGLSVSSRGHVLIFSGLEIALNPGSFPFQVFVPVVPEVDIDLGHNAQIENLVINGKRRRMSLSARATVTPKAGENRLKYSQQRSSYLAQYSCDVGAWVTRIGNFHK